MQQLPLEIEAPAEIHNEGRNPFLYSSSFWRTHKARLFQLLNKGYIQLQKFPYDFVRSQQVVSIVDQRERARNKFCVKSLTSGMIRNFLGFYFSRNKKYKNLYLQKKIIILSLHLPQYVPTHLL